LLFGKHAPFAAGDHGPADSRRSVDSVLQFADDEVTGTFLGGR